MFSKYGLECLIGQIVQVVFRFQFMREKTRLNTFGYRILIIVMQILSETGPANNIPLEISVNGKQYSSASFSGK